MSLSALGTGTLNYFDGTEWVDTWRFEDMKSVPLAVKVEFKISARTGEFEEEARKEEERNEDRSQWRAAA